MNSNNNQPTQRWSVDAHHLHRLVQREQKRLTKIKQDTTRTSPTNKKVIGILPGDGIGPIIMEQALRLMKVLLKARLTNDEVEICPIEGLTLENRIKTMQALPPEVLAQAQKCDALLKGPTTTTKATDNLPNLPSANAALRRELDLFAAVREVRIPERNIDWTFFRENIEGPYLFGNDGILIEEEVAIDFVVTTKTGSLRIARAAFEYARAQQKPTVTAITKSNIVKLTDGNFLKYCRQVSKEYPEIVYQEYLVDVTAAKLNNDEFNKNLSVFILPNLYGDIITDIAIEIQGTQKATGSANLGTHQAIFETTHGTAPYLMEHHLQDYASPKSLFKSLEMLLAHCGFQAEAALLQAAMETNKDIVVNGQRENATAAYYTDQLIDYFERKQDA